jgi:L,D-transpeptidase YcbB
MNAVKYTLIAMLLCMAVSCKQKKENNIPLVSQADAETVQGNFSPETKKQFDSSAIIAFIDSFPLFAGVKTDLENFYRPRHFSYAWFNENGMIEQASNLYNRIKNVNDEGIDNSKLLYQQQLNDLMEASPINGKDSLETTIELMLTAQYLQYARTVWVGLKEKESLALEWLLPRKTISYTQTLDSLLAGKDILDHPPVFRQYYLMKEFLKKYKASEAVDSTPIITKISSFKKGDSSVAVSAFRKKLFLLGDLQANSGSNYLDGAMETGVKQFQQRLGLNPTGIIKKNEIDELNVPMHKRIEQILVNMERSRWVPDDVKNNYLIVNIPEFKLHALENDSLVWSMNVVVGKNQHKTVIFNGDIRYIVFSPYWNIPYSIMKNETLPALKRNPNYLKTHNMEWNGNSIRQRPGPNNSLGLVKFLFPNSHSIYLHDSPAKSLFNESSRAFSHGCIRVAEPKKLAIYLLRNDSSWNENKIIAAMNAAKEQTVTLKQSVPVFIAYFTAWVGRDGTLNFRKDIYGRDTTLLAMIMAKE